MMKSSKVFIALGLVALIAAFFAFDLGQYLTLESIKARQTEFAALYQARPLQFIAVFFVIYVAVTAVSLPGAAVMTLLGGAVFGLFVGTLVVSFASSIGATCAFLASRFVLQDMVQNKAGARLDTINQGVDKEGGFYLFTLRLIPVVPFWLINLAMGLTRLPTRTFYWVSQLGMLAGTVAYVNLGTQLASIDSLRGLLSPGLLASFVFIGVLPLIAKRIVEALRARKIYANWTRPKRFDRNMVVIGGGSAGLVTSYIAAAVKAQVTLIERDRMGGDCLNTGCVPSKALIKTARTLHQARHSSRYGIRKMSVEFDFAQAMERVESVIKAIEPHDSVARYRSLGVDVLRGEATIVSPWEIEIATQDEKGQATGQTKKITAREIVIATGARPFIPPISGLEEVGYLSSDSLWGLRELPERLLVLGGGPIGCELSQAFARLGSSVIQVEMAPRLMMREDPDVSDLIHQSFRDDGVDLRLGHRALRFEMRGEQRVLHAERIEDSSEVEILFDQVLVAVGRSARVEGFGLEQLGVRLSGRRTVEVNEFLETNFPNIHACGDVAGPYQFTHTAAHMAWYAAVNALFGRFRRFRIDYSVIPWATFTAPEVARVGLNETEAKEKGIEFELSRFGIDDLDRAIADGTAEGFVKVLTRPGSDKILGVTIVGEHAGDLIAEFVIAMKHGLGLNKILGTIHIYPTLAEANKYVAGEWKRAHAPERVLQWVRRFHEWQIR